MSEENINTEFVSFGQLHKGKKLIQCLSEEEVYDILDESKYTFYRVEDLNKIVGVDIEVC